MNRLVFQEVEALFHEAVEFDPPTRRLFLARVAREHSPDVSSMLERMISSDDSGTRWTDLGLTHGPSHHIPEPETPGSMIGHFRLIKRLGYGGHGEVYLAEQTEPVTRTVALKMVRTGTMSHDVSARFHAEQQSLALMDHPNIASVYETGLADRGRMYFAMAYVEGEAIDTYCNQRHMPIPERLSLLIKVCRAVQHAHQKGLIHRDLKPTNILVTEREGRPEPVLIDFGIAVASVPDDDSDPQADRRHSMAIGTPAFMSPEQAGPPPRDVDTRSDVYALGVLLCALLTDNTPLDTLVSSDASPAEIRRCIIEGRAPALTQLLPTNDTALAAVARSRGCSPARLRRLISHDLDAIARKAIAHDRRIRYQTTDALAADIEATLGARPITAGTHTRGDLARKFVRRNRISIAVSSVVLGTLLVGAIGLGAGMLRAESAANESDAVNSFLEDLLTSSRSLEKGATVSFVDVLASGSAMAEVRLHEYPHRAGEIHSVLGRTYSTLGLYADAENELIRAIDLLTESLGTGDPETLRAATALASLYRAQLRMDEAQAIAEEVALHSEGRQGKFVEHYLVSQRILCNVAVLRGEYEWAEGRLEDLIQLVDAALGPLDTEAYNVRVGLSSALNRHAISIPAGPEADGLRRRRLDLMRETTELQHRRFDGDYAVPLIGSEMALAQILVDLREYEEAEAILVELLPQVETRLGRAHGHFIASSTAMASLKYGRGEYQEAADYHLDALEGTRALHSNQHPNVLAIMRDGMPHLDAAGRVDEGMMLSRELFETLEKWMGPDSTITADARAWLMRFCDLDGRLEEAEMHYVLLRDAMQSSEDIAMRGYVALLCAGHMAHTARFAEAEATLKTLAGTAGGVRNGVSRVAHRDDLARMFVQLYELWSRPDMAAEYQAIIDDMHSGPGSGT